MQMDEILIFLPCSLYGSQEGYLYGAHPSPSCFYVLGTEPQKRVCIDSKISTIGHFLPHDNFTRNDFQSMENNKDWINVFINVSELKVQSLSQGRKTVVVYDDSVLCHSELMLSCDKDVNVEKDHFRTLAILLQNQISSQSFFGISIVVTAVSALLQVVSVMHHIVTKLQPLLKYTSLGSQINMFLKTLVWTLTSMKEQRKVSLKVGNCILATTIDVCGGVLLLHLLDYVRVTNPLSELLLFIAKDVVQSLQELLQWLSGSPAGLKLNGPFNIMMGRFFVYHINLWWIFLSVTRPLWELAFQVFLGLGALGLTFQAAILADLLALVSFHIYCIYVYAARLYYLQLSGLLALWRLFLGRKRNPLRSRVDSCQYSPDQLFVGTLAFTILLFLLPTTLMYYIVFTTMRLILLGLAGILTQACYIVRALPLYATLHWLLGSNSVCSSVNLKPKSCSKNENDTLILFVSPIADSWWKTICSCVPDTVSRPPAVQCGQLIQKLACGELVYPV